MDDERQKLLDTFKEKPEVLVDFLETDNEERKNTLEANRLRTQIECDGQRDINKMRRRWSNWLLACIVLIVVLDFIFVYLLGKDFLQYHDQNLVFAFVIENLVKIAGLSYLVVKFLFSTKNIK